MPSFADFTKNYLGESSNNTAKNKKKVNFGDFTNNYLAQKESRTDYGITQYNELISAYRQASDNASKESNKWHEKSYYSSQTEYLSGLEKKKKQLEDYFKNNSQKYSKEFLAQMNENLKNMSVTSASLQQNNTSVADYYSQWENEDAYNRDYDHYTYSNKYKGKTYADLMKSKAELKEKASGNKDDEALSRELYWLENHSTDRQFAETMTTEELKQYKEGNEAKKKELQAKVSKLKTEKMAHERGGQTANARYKTVLKELESAEKELKGLGDNSSVLYYDETGAVTVDNILTSRENEEILTKINGDENVKSSYNKALEAAKKLEAVKASISAEKIPSQELLAEEKRLQGIIDEFESLGYDFDSLQHYQGWKTDRENLAKKQAEGEQYAKEHPVAATVQSILTAPLTPFEYAQNLVDANKYGYSNIYDDQNIMQNEMYQNTVSTMIGDKVYEATGSEIASWLASTAYSGAASAVSSGMTALACTAMFGGAGTYVASAIMGMESASSSYRSAIMNGSTNGQAILYSVASGTAEAFFEYASLDKLVGNVFKAGWNTETLSAFFKSALKNSGKVFGQGLVEASEEFATEISNKLADSIINGNTSAYETAIRKYKSQGYSDMDAKELAQKDYVMDIINSAVGGFFGGIAAGGAVNSFNMGLAGKATASNAKFYNQQGQNIIENDKVGELVGQAHTLMNGSKALQSLANEVAGVKEKDAQSNRHARNVGRLQSAVQKAQFEGVAHADRVAFKTMVKEELKGNKDIKNIDKVAEIITKKHFATLSPSEQKTFDKVNGFEVLDKVKNSKDLEANIEKTSSKNASNFRKTATLAIDEKQAIAEGTGYDISDDGKNYIEATDEEVSVKKIKSVGEGDVVVELANGESISVGELKVNKDIAVIANGLNTLNAEFGIDSVTADYIYNKWQSMSTKLKANEFMLGVVSAMEYGRMNNDKGLEGTAFTKDLPAEFRKELFDMARKSYQGNTDVKQKAIDKAVETRKQSGKGKARAEGTGTVKYDGIKASDLDSKQKAQADLISAIFSTMGINVEFFASPVKNGKHVGESGSYNPNTNTIRIDIFAGNDGQGIMLYTASHELTHFIREWSPTKFKVFADFLMQNYNENNVPVKELIKAKMNNAKLNDRTLSYDAAYEEVVADACEKFLADSKAKDILVSLAQQDQSLAQKVLQWIKDFVNLIKNALDALKGVEPDSQEAKYVQEMTDALEKLHSLWDEALFDAMESYQWVGERVNQNEIAGIDYDALEAAKNENGEALLQIRAIQHDIPEYRAMLEKHSNLSKVEIDNLFNMMDKAFAIIEENLEILDYAWDENLNEDGTWDDSTDARAFKPVKPNSDKLYKYSLDFSTLCRKRLLQQVIVEELSMALDRAVTKAESIAIRDELIKLQEEGRQLEIACALCYVESARMKSPEQIQKFLNDAGQKVREFFGAKAKTDVVTAEENIRKKLAKQYATEIKEGKMPSPTETTTTKSGKKKWISLSSLPSNVAWEIRDAKRKAKASYVPTAEEQELINIADKLPTSTFTTAEGLKNLAKEQPVIFDAYTSFVRNATHSKGTEKDVWYRVGDADVIGDDLIAAMNNENGLRSQSWSDFQVIHLLDYVGAIIELSTKNAKTQSYTKVADYVNLMGLTDMMINLSLIPTSEFNGKLDFDSVEGMAFKIALELRDKYPSTAGTISIGVADEQIKLLLESKDIDYVIPYHQSGMKQAVRKVMHIPTWVSYENYQGEKKITSRKDAIENAKKYGVKLLATSDANYHKAPNFSEWFDLELARKTAELENLRPTNAKEKKKYGVMYGGYKAMQEAADNYIKLCAERGLQPKFSYGKGDFSMESNYWKLLIDRKMINQKTGEIIEQKAVKPVFNESEVLDILNNEIARYEGVKEDFDYATHYVVERFLNGDMNEHINDIAKHIGETVNNVTKVASVDVEVKHQDRDSEGRELTPEQAEFFKDSKVRDENGNLRVVYHGTPNGDFNTFRISEGAHSSLMAQYGAGYYFDSVRASAARYANDINKSTGKKNPKVFKVYLNITNPLEIYDEYIGDSNGTRAISKQQFADVINRGNYEWFFTNGMPFELRNYLGKTKEEIQQLPRDEIISKWVDMTYDRAYFESEILSSMVKAYRGDSILAVMKEVFGKDGVKVIDKYGEMYVAWDNNSIKLVDNLNPTENEDIRYQDRVTPKEDAEYLELAENPEENEARLREMVDAVAKRAGYTTKAYHGTNNFGFTRADVSKSDDGISFFATDSEEAAGTYSGTEKTKNISEASKEELYNNEMIVENIYDKASNFVDYCNRTLGVQDFVDLDYFKIKIQECLNDFGNGSSLSDVTGDFFVFCDELFYGFIDNYYSVHYNENVFADKTTAWSDETKKLSDNFYNYVNKIIQEFQQLKSTDTGIYGLYANTEGLFEIDAQGKRWNAIPFDRYDTAGFNPIVNTRQVARYAKAEGYKGVKIENVYDDGGRGVKNQSKPATVYIFFNPQEQVKSADLVTYDDEGNIIPLSERFNEGNEDIRYQLRGVNEQGIEVYETSENLKNLSLKNKKELLLKAIRNEYIGRTAKFNKNGTVYYATLDAVSARKSLYGDKKSDKKGYKAKINIGADGNYFELVENALYDSSKDEIGKTTNTDIHDNVSQWDYYIKTIVSDGRYFKVLINVADKGNNQYVYDVSLKEIKKGETSSSSNATFNQEVTPKDSISNSKENVNTKFQDREVEYGKLTQDRIDHIIKYYGYGSRVDRAEAWIADISPSDFIDLTTSRETRYEGRDFFDTNVEGDHGSVMGDRDYIADLKNEREMPYLVVDMDTGKVLGHNGRHRMRALEKAGARKTPIVIKFYKDGSLYKGDDSGVRLESINVKRLASQFDEEWYFEYHGYIHRIIPLNEDHREEIEKTYLAKPFDVKYGWAIAYQDRAVSNREILVDAMSNIDELSVEDRNRLAIYREKIDSMNELERELSSVGKQIHEIITTPNSDRSELAKLNAKADTLRKKISRVDGALLKIEAMKPIQNLVEIRKKQIIKAQNQKAQEQRHRNVEGRNKTALKNKIKRVVNELNSLLNNGTKERNVKFELQETVDKALEMAGYLTTNFSNEEVLMADTMVTLTSEEQKMVTRYKKLIAQRDAYVGRINEQQKQEGNTNYKLIEDIEKMRNTTVKEIKKLEKKLDGVIERNRAKLNEDLVSEAIDSLAASYRALEESQSEFVKGAYSKYVYDRIVSFKDAVKGTKLSDMTLVQLQEMYDIYKMVMATVRASNQLFVDGKREDVEKAVSDVLFELDSRNKAKTLPYKAVDKTLDIIRDFSYKELKPVYFFERLGSKTLKQIFFDEARKGEDVFARDLYEAYQFAQEKRKQYGYSSWDMDNGYDIKLQSGRTINLKLDELMSIYAYSKREQALEHMSNGGFVFNSKEYFNTDKKSKKTVRVAGGIPYRFNEIDLVKVKQMLTDEQVMFADEMQGYLTAMGTKGNEVSRALYGIDLFKEKHYFPLMSSKDYITELNQPAGEVSLKNTGMAKATVPHAKNPIVLQGFEDVWASHVNKMSTYHALVLPIENMNKVLNYAEYIGEDMDSTSVKAVIGDIFTQSATDYIKAYLRDLNGGVTTQGATGLFTKHFSKFKKTAVAASLSTVVQQPTAIFRAMAMVNPKYFVGIEKGDFDEIKKYAPIAIIKEMGGFDAGSGRTASSYLLQKTYEGGKDKAKAFFSDEQYRDSYFMWGAEKGDELGWNIIWSAVKKEVADTTTLTKGTEEFLQECGKRFTEVISYTQVYDSVFSRSEYMRSKNDIVKMATAFMGEPTTSFNMLFNAVLQAKRGEMSKGKAIGTVGAIATSIIMAAVAKSFVYALRDDDEDESYLYKYIDSLTSNLASDMLPHNMLPFVKDVTSIFSGWEVERTDMAIFKDLKDAIDGLDSDTKSSYRKIEDLAGAIAAFGGIPVKNVMRTFREGYNLIANVVDDNTGYDGGTPASSEVNAYLEKGKNDKAKETIKEILEDKTEAYVKQGYSKEESAKKAKSALKSSITSYWKELYLEAYRNKDNAEMLRIRKALQATGLYDNVVETCQEWVKNSKNKTEDNTTWNKW